MLHLILGGARSGKSRHAQALATATGHDVIYVATARHDPDDAEMQARITRHRADRPSHWTTIECTMPLAETLRAHDAAQRVLLVDCLSLWLAQCLWTPAHELQSAHWQHRRDELLSVLPTLSANVLLVSNEVGCGVVPDNAAARRFADEQGWLNQSVAAVCSHVTLMAAGLPLRLK